MDAFPHDHARTQEANARNHIGGHTGGVHPRSDQTEAQRHKESCPDCDKDVGAQPRHALAPLALQADGRPEQQGKA